MSPRPLPRLRRTRLGLMAVGIVLTTVAATCTEDPADTASPTCRQGTATLTIFQGPSGHCISRERLVGYRCQGAAPEIVLGEGTPDERRFLGGAFAVGGTRLPDEAEVLGVGSGTEAVALPGQDALYTVNGTDVQRWLAIPRAADVLPAGPDAFMIGDSILYGGQYAIDAALPEWTLGFDGSNGRSSVSGITIAEASAEAGHDVVMVELGTNDRSVEAFRDNARQILTALKDVPLVLWQTVKGPEDLVDAEEINAAIRELVSTRSNAAIADWAGLVKDEDLAYDGVHPTTEHEDAMATVVAPMLRQWWEAVTAERPACG